MDLGLWCWLGIYGWLQPSNPPPHCSYLSLTEEMRKLIVKGIDVAEHIGVSCMFLQRAFSPSLALEGPTQPCFCADWHQEDFFQGLVILNPFIQEPIGPNSEGAGTNHLWDQADNSLWFDPGQRTSAKVSADAHRLNIKKPTTKQNQNKHTPMCSVTATVWAQEEKQNKQKTTTQKTSHFPGQLYFIWKQSWAWGCYKKSSQG